MKREGRQHGMVRTYRILPSTMNPISEPRFINRFDSVPATAGLFTKVSRKPTNHSKFTGKCGRVKCSECHAHPACKSKEKTKGAQKLRSTCDVSTKCGLVSWRVVDDARPDGLKKVSGYSATGLLDQLGIDDSRYYVELDYDYDNHDNGGDDVFDEAYGSEIESAAVEIKNGNDNGDDDDNDDDIDDEMNYCDVEVVWEKVDVDGDEGWCLLNFDGTSSI